MSLILMQFDALIQSGWFLSAAKAVFIVVITALAAQVAGRAIRHFLAITDEKTLPSSSIFINSARSAVWIIGICILLDTCFKVNVSAVIAALGVGGIAISLGFKDTIANLIGGLQVSIMRIIKPGDHIEVGLSQGVVQDVTWRHTRIINTAGQQIIIPNSVINKTALVQLLPLAPVIIPLVISDGGSNLTSRLEAIERTALDAATSVGAVVVHPCLSLLSIEACGVAGKLSFVMDNPDHVAAAQDAVVRSIAPYALPKPVS